MPAQDIELTDQFQQVDRVYCITNLGVQTIQVWNYATQTGKELKPNGAWRFGLFTDGVKPQPCLIAAKATKGRGRARIETM